MTHLAPRRPPSRRPRRFTPIIALTLSLLPLAGPDVHGSDHVDAPATSADAAVDLGDLYAWHSGGSIVVVLTYSTLMTPMTPSVYDDEVLYTICIDNTGTAAEAFDYLDNDNDNVCDIPIHVRMGQDLSGDWGVQVENLPGSTGTFSGPVEQVLDGGGGTRAMVGQFDDPFFLDFDGLVATLQNLVDDASPEDVVFGSLLAGAPVDAFEGTNAMGIVLEFDEAVAAAGSDYVQIWATTGRL